MGDLMDKIVSLCKRRGFIFPNSDIYGGLSNTWDYGPYGVEFKNNVKRAWWKANVHCRDDIYGMDAAILMHSNVWDASGHIKQFHDYKSDCKSCHKLFKLDDLKDKNIEGSGIGLTLVDHIVKAHDGEISLQSYRGKGTRVSVRLPVKGRGG